jgi:hypothetical protein
MIKAMPTHKPSLLYHWILTGKAMFTLSFWKKLASRPPFDRYQRILLGKLPNKERLCTTVFLALLRCSSQNSTIRNPAVAKKFCNHL